MAYFYSTGTAYTRSGTYSYDTQGDGRTAADFHYEQNQAANTTTFYFQPVAYFFSAAGGGESNTFSIVATAKVTMNGKTVTKSVTISKVIGTGTATVWSGMITIGDFPMTNTGTGTATITLTSSAVKVDGYTLGGAAARSITFTYSPPTINRNYTVAYDMNGGTGSIDTQTGIIGNSITLSSTTPTRTGYTFSHWNDKQDGSGTNYFSGGSFVTSSVGSTTLYAQWTINTYTVSYNANGGSGAPAAQTKTYGTNLTLSSTQPTRTGYTFQGWGTSASDTTTDYEAGGTYTTNASVTLYAIWNIITYTISYNANGGSGAPSSQSKTYGTNITLSSTKPTRSKTTANGYKITFNANDGVCTTSSLTATNTTTYAFKSWNTASGGAGTEYDPGDVYSANSNATLYAQWNITTTKGSITLPTATRDGYTFMGWAETDTATFGSTGTYTPTGTKTLYAVWSLIPRIPLLKTKYNNSFVTNALIKVKVNGKWVIVKTVKLKTNGDF